MGRLRSTLPLAAALALAPACFTGAPPPAGETATGPFGEATVTSDGEATTDEGASTSTSTRGDTTAEDTTTDAASSGGESSTTADDPITTGTTTTGEATTGATDDPPATTDALPDECPRVRVVVGPGEALNVRPDPSTQNPPLGTLPNGAIVDVLAEVSGETLEGNDQWFQIDADGLVGFVWGGLAECTTDEPPELGPPTGFFLPLQCGSQAKVSQGNFGDFSHQGTSAYAFDFSLGTGTPLVAIADGVVHYVYDKTKPGDPCYNGGDQSCSGKANVVTLLHGDDTTSIYAHLSEVQVSVGAFVPRGEVVGLSGSSGWSTGRHAHVARQENCNWGFCQSIAVAFEDVAGDGVPKTGDTVTSMNCP